MSSSDSQIENSDQLKRKKGVINTANYKRNIIRSAKVQGEAHVNYAGKEIPKKVPPSTCR